MKKKIGILLIIAMIFTQFNFSLAFADEAAPATGTNASEPQVQETVTLEDQLAKVTKYYQDRGKDAKIEAPFEAMARFAIGETPTEAAFPVVEETESLYYLKHREMREAEKDGEAKRLIFTESTDGLGPQIWMATLSLDLMAAGLNPSDFQGRNYIQELLLSQNILKSWEGEEYHLFTNYSQNYVYFYPKATDGLAITALDAFWGGEWEACGNGSSKKIAMDHMLTLVNSQMFSFSNSSQFEIDNFSKNHLGLPKDRNTTIWYNLFWLIPALDTDGSIEDSVKSNLVGKIVGKRVGKTLVYKLNSEVLSAHIIANLIAKQPISDDLWTDLAKYQLEDGSYRLNIDDEEKNAEATALAAIALDYGKRFKEDNTAKSVFNRIKEANKQDRAEEMAKTKALFDKATEIEPVLASAENLDELAGIIDSKYSDKRILSSNARVYDAKAKEVIPLGDGEPDEKVSLYVLLEDGNIVVPVESKQYIIEPEDKDFKTEKNALLAKEYYTNCGEESALAKYALAGGWDFKDGIAKPQGSYESYNLLELIASKADPRRFQKINPVNGEIVTKDFIGEILSLQKENGLYLREWSPSTDIDCTLTLEAYFGGRPWGNEKAGTKYGRVGAIEAFLSNIIDTKDDENVKELIDENQIDVADIEGCRTVGALIGVFDSGKVNIPQTDCIAISLLKRWENDETLIEVNGIKKPLKELARKEIKGIFKTVKYFASLSNENAKLSNVNEYAYITSAYIAAGEKKALDDSKILNQIRNCRMSDGRYLSLTHIKNIVEHLASGESAYSHMMPIALGDYLYNRSTLAEITFDPKLFTASENLRKDAEDIAIDEEVKDNLNLPSEGFYGSKITWESSNPEIINAGTGEVKNPKMGEEEVFVTLTATLTYGDETRVETFYVKVVPTKDKEEQNLDEDYNELNVPLFTVKDIELPSVGKHGSEIKWESSDPDIISLDGKVTLGDEEKEVTLTATLKNGVFEKKKEFSVRVFIKAPGANDPVYQAIVQLREYYNDHRTLAGSYWDVWAAKSVLGDDFDKYGFKIYDITTHKNGNKWAGTDHGAVILQIMAQGDNPYNYLGIDWVKKAQDYVDSNGWGAWGEPIYLMLGLDAAKASPEGHKYDKERIKGFFLAQLKDLQWGADLAGWSLIPMASEMIRNGQTESTPELDKFKAALKKSQPTSGMEQSYFNTGHVDGAINALSTGCVVSGFAAMNKAGVPGFDILSDEWKTGTATNKKGPLDTMYTYEVKGKVKVPTQIAIEFGDVYYGDSIWRRVGVTEENLKVLLSESKTLIDAGQGSYSDKSYGEFKTAYDAALKVSEDKENMRLGYFGREYFNLRDSKKNLKEKGTLTITVYGTEKQGKVLDSLSVKEKGTALEVIKKIAKENRISITVKENELIELSGVKKDEKGKWYLYTLNEQGDGERVLEPLNQYQIKEDTNYVFKYCKDTEKIGKDATLNRHLVSEAAEYIKIGGNINDKMEVTGNLELPDSGIYGTSVTWMADKLLVIDEIGQVKRAKNDDLKVKLTAKVQLSGQEEKIEFNVVVKSTDGPVVNPKPTTKEAYIRIQGPVGETWSGEMAKKGINVEPGETAYSLLEKSGATLNVDKNTQYGVYIRGINGLSEFDRGKYSGWLYRVNGVFPGHSCAYENVKAGDYVEWLYTRDLGRDVGGYVMGVEGTGSSVDVTTAKDGKNEVTTVKTEVTIGSETGSSGSISTATVTVKDENAAEMVKQAKEMKSSEIVLNADKVEVNADKIKVELPKKVAENILADTKADLTIKLPEAEVKLSQAALKEIIAQAKGNKLIVEVEKVKNVTDEQKKLVGNAAELFRLTVKLGDVVIHSFGEGKITVRKLIPNRLIGKNLAAIYIPEVHISENKPFEVLEGKGIVGSSKNFYEFTTSHFSDFAIVDADEVGIAVAEVMTTDSVKSIVKAIKLKVKTKLLKKSIRITAKVDKETILKFKDNGYMIKYKYYRASNKNGKFKLIGVKKGNKFTDSKVNQYKTYYYKARIVVCDGKGNVVTTTSLKGCKASKKQYKVA